MTGVLLGPDVIRFAIVAIVGLSIDVSLSWVLAVFWNISLPLAAAAGFVAGAAINYLLHEFWTFRTFGSGVNVRRGLLYTVVVELSLGARIAAVAILERSISLGPSRELQALLLATVFSFTINYLLSKYVVFRQRSANVILVTRQNK